MSYCIKEILNLIPIGIACVAAYFAYKSARMSEISNKAQFSPLLVPIDISYVSGQVFLQVRNRSTYQNAYAKNVQITVGKNLSWQLSDIDPEGFIHVVHNNIKQEDVLSQKMVLSYEDILGNKFETRCNLSTALEKSTDYSSDATKITFDWKYIQK